MPHGARTLIEKQIFFLSTHSSETRENISEALTVGLLGHVSRLELVNEAADLLVSQVQPGGGLVQVPLQQTPLSVLKSFVLCGLVIILTRRQNKHKQDLYL